MRLSRGLDDLREIWPEIWDTIGPMFAGVIATGQSTWVEDQALVPERNGFPEECNFTYSFSPLFDDDGTIRGVLNIATETTTQVTAQRRLICLTDLSAALFEAEHITDVFVRAATALSRSRTDIEAADFYVRVADQLVLVSSNRRLSVSPIGPDLVADIVGTALRSSFRRTTEVDKYRLISDTLQQAMLKPAIDLPTVAARYLPEVGNLAVGGDWYDVIDLGADIRAIVVGDCVGHGLAAATVMAQLRSATRATHQLRQNDVIIMYADGLIERRGENIDVGLQRLAVAASTLYGSNVQSLADGLLFHLQPENTRDDVVLVVKHMPAAAARAPSEIAMSSR